MLRSLLVARLSQCSKSLPDFLIPSLEQTGTFALDFSRDVKTQANQVRIGNVIELDGKLVHVVKAVHGAGQGRQLGNVQMELRDVKSKKKHNVRFRTSDMVERVKLETKDYQVLYTEGDTVHLMDEYFEQAEVDKAIFGDQAKWLLDGLDINVDVLQTGEPVIGRMAKNIVAEVEDADPSVKGDTAGSTNLKECTLVGGAQVKVPGHVSAGHKIVINTEDGSFVRKVT